MSDEETVDSRRRVRLGPLEDQALAILRDAGGFPMSTSAVGKLLPTQYVTTNRPCRCPCGHEHQSARSYAKYPNEAARPILDRLLRAGLIEKIKLSGGAGRSLYWRYWTPS